MRIAFYLLPLAVLPLIAADTLDRIAVVVDDRVITRNDIRRQIRLTSLINGDAPDYSPRSLKETAETLIRQTLIRREIELSRYVPPTMDEVEKNIEANLGRRGPEFMKRMESLGFSEADIKEAFLWLVSYSRFVAFRFSPGVSITPEEIREYYEKEYLPTWKKSAPGAEPEPLDQIEPRVIRILEVRKSNEALDLWLSQTRQQVPIRYFEEAFQ